MSRALNKMTRAGMQKVYGLPEEVSVRWSTKTGHSFRVFPEQSL